jgi:hypothetical protein
LLARHLDSLKANKMVQPIQYLPDPPDLGLSLLRGLQAGEVIRGIRQGNRQEEDAQRMQQEYSTDVQNAFDLGTSKAFAELAVKYPQQGQGLQAAYNMLGSDERNAEFTGGMQVFSALQSGSPDVAKRLINERIIAAKNSGKDTAELETIASQIDQNPTLAQNFLGLTLSTIDPDRFNRLSGAIGGGVDVQSSQILDDGTTVVVTKDGRTQVRNARGEVVTGEAAQRAIAESRQSGVDVAGRTTGRTEAVKRAQDIAQKAFDQTEKIQVNIGNLDDVIKAIDGGANTGRIANQFPDWKASTIALRNAQNRLGLDVVGSVTFGALSESELALALQTGLPSNLDQAELRDWTIGKKQAQEKLLGYLNEQARFLSQDDTTLNDWLDRVKAKGQQTRQAVVVPAPLQNRSYLNFGQGTP